jgi:GntR family transcriptional repressor for pyruvate dehydrogenase complex
MSTQGAGALWAPIKESGSLPERIAERIGTLIAEHQLAPGERLPSEREMSKMLGVSRPALREAVKILEAHGRLEVRHGQGVFIGSGRTDPVRAGLFGLEVSLAELYAMREVLEAPAAEWAASRATPEDVAMLAGALAAEEEARTDPIDFSRLGILDADFHLRIVQLAKNRFLSRTLGVLQEMLAAGMETTLTIPGRVGQARRDHRAIFEAISRNDPQAARAAVVAHIHGARDAALDRVRAQTSDGSGHHPPRSRRRSSAS